jgi:hypothetical protein
VPPAIYCTADTEVGSAGNFSTVSGNILRGPLTGIVTSRVTGIVVTDNRVDGLFRGWFGVRADDCAYTTIADNHVASVGFGVVLSEGDHNIVRGCRLALALVGVLGTDETDISIRDGEVVGTLFHAILLLLPGGDALISDVRIANCGSVGIGTVKGAVFVMSGPFVEPITNSLRIDGCEILESGVWVTGGTTAGPVRGIQAWVPNCQIVNNRVISTDPAILAAPDEHRALLIAGPLSYAPLPVGVSSAIVANNVFRGPGVTHLVEFVRTIFSDNLAFCFHKIGFNGNFCDHVAERVNEPITVVLAGMHTVASANHVTAPEGVRSIDIRGNFAKSVIGNITSGDIVDSGIAPVPAPLTSFNINV